MISFWNKKDNVSPRVGLRSVNPNDRCRGSFGLFYDHSVSAWFAGLFRGFGGAGNFARFAGFLFLVFFN